MTGRQNWWIAGSERVGDGERTGVIVEGGKMERREIGGKVTGRGNWASGGGWQGQQVRSDFGQWGWGRQGIGKREIGTSGKMADSTRGGKEILGGVEREVRDSGDGKWG